MNKDLFSKLQDFELYKKRVSSMEESYLEKLRHIELEKETIEHSRDLMAEKNGSKSVALLARVRTLEVGNLSLTTQLMEKANVMLTTEAAYEEQRHEFKSEIERQDRLISNQRQRISDLQAQLIDLKKQLRVANAAASPPPSFFLSFPPGTFPSCRCFCGVDCPLFSTSLPYPPELS